MIVPAPSQQHQLISKGASQIDNCLNSLFSASKRKARDYKSVESLVAVPTERRFTGYCLICPPPDGEQMSNEKENARRHFSPEDKVKIPRLHLLEKMPVSEVCDTLAYASHYSSRPQFYPTGPWRLDAVQRTLTTRIAPLKSVGRFGMETSEKEGSMQA